uniref:hypothetical protein n=1 Tax=Blautia wexlerae TaxID=418240 RepID=UPI00321A3901
MKNSSERKRYKTNPNFDAYLLYSYIQMKRNASDKISRDKADKLIYEYLNKLDIENPIIRINTAFKGCSSLEKIS